MFDVKNLSAIEIGLASPETIRSWGDRKAPDGRIILGEVTKGETINYRSLKPEPDGLYCEKIFGPAKDYECHCGHLKKVKYIGKVCEKCGVEITTKDVRRERMGYINLACPCTHIWYLKGIPSRISLILDIPPKQLEEVAYYAANFVLDPGTSEVLKQPFNQFINEKNGKQIFKAVLEEIRDHKLIASDNDYDLEKVERLIIHCDEPLTKSPFEFDAMAAFISKYVFAKFGTGAEAIQYLLQNVDLKDKALKVREELKTATASNRVKLTKRLQTIEAFRKLDSDGNQLNKPEWMVLDVIPVIPPDLRPMLQLDGGRFATSDLNDLYRRVISRNNRLKRLIDMRAPRAIQNNEKRMLQEAVDSLIDNGRRTKPVQANNGRALKSLSSTLKGKPGRFRQNLLGKRVDYSGRSVIAVGPYLKMYQCGLPREMATILLKPFIICELRKEGISQNKAAEEMIESFDPKVVDIVERIISKHPVLLNRAPTLHRLGIQAFQPILVDGRAIRLHPLVCTGFNADFDGDQMAVHVPLSKAAQEEALNLMLASNNILGPKDGKPIVTPSQDMVLGNYYLTLESSKEMFLEKAKHFEEIGDFEEAEKYNLYAESEGKVFKTVNDLIKAYTTKQISLHNRIAILGSALLKSNFTEEMNNSYLITSVGKVIFNCIFPADFPYVNVPNDSNLEEVTYLEFINKFFVKKGTNIKEVIASRPLLKPFKKKDLGLIINEIVRRYGTSKTSAVLDKLKDQGFKYSTVAGITISLSDISIIEGKKEMIAEADKKVAEINDFYDLGYLTDEERHNKICEVWDDKKGLVHDMQQKLKEQLEKDDRNPIYMMSDSGARGNLSNFTQLEGMRGLMGNTSGGTIELPVKSCFREGMSVSEFFISTHGARKGGADTALKTADSGYLTRRLVDVSQDVIVREVDCHTDHGSIVRTIVDTAKNEVIASLYDRLVGRYSLHNIFDKEGNLIVEENTMIDEIKAKAIIDAGIEEVEIKSLFGCETKDGVCVHCYGRDLATGKEVKVGEAVGIRAAQSIGEPGTQLTMRTFHTGGVAGADITTGLPRVAELFEARNPKGKAVISEIKGKVIDIKKENNCDVITVSNDIDGAKVYRAPYGAKLRVKIGDEVQPGGKITEGAIAPTELLEYSDVSKVEAYILKEVLKVYADQKISISDKHIEVIVRQMLRKVFIVESGDTDLLPGDRVSLNEFTQKNTEALLEGKRPAVMKPLILGVIKSALASDSFLSAASFQETTRVLTEAAVCHKKDILHGLKENVIAGRLIPAGRGLLSEEDEEARLEDFDVEEKMDEVKETYIEAHDIVSSKKSKTETIDIEEGDSPID